MINGQQKLAALAHCALGLEEIFRRGFISYQRIRSQITQAMDTLRSAVCRPAYQATAFVGIRFARMREEFLSVSLGERYHST